MGNGKVPWEGATGIRTAVCDTEGHWLALIHYLSERHGAVWVGSGPEGGGMEWPARFPATVHYEIGPGFRGNLNVLYTRFVYHDEKV